MIATLDDIGIQSIPGVTTVTEVSYERTLDTKDVIQNSDSSFGQAQAVNPTGPWSIKGAGSPAIAVGTIGNGSISVITGGKSLVLSATHNQGNKAHESYEISGHHYPGAS